MNLNINSVSKSFNSTTVLDKINLNVNSGDTMLIVGKNGAGKTTILRLILGLYKPDSGKITVNNIDTSSDTFTALKQSVGFLNDNIGLFRDLNAWDNLEFFHRIYFPNSYKSKRKDDLTHVLKRVDLYQYKDKKIDFFSRGMKQRLAFARSIINDPKLLILDEPHRGLDVEGKELIKDVVEEMHRKGTTIIINSHDLNDVQEFVTHLAFLYQGHIVCQGAYQEVINQFSENKYKLVVDKPKEAYAVLQEQLFIKNITLNDNILILELNGVVEQLSIWLSNHHFAIIELSKVDNNLTTLYKKIIS